MKTQSLRLSKAIIYLLLFLTAVFAKAEIPLSDTISFSALSFQQAPPDAVHFDYTKKNFIIGDAGYGFANNVWTNELYTFNPDDLATTSVSTSLTMVSSSGDFHPDDAEHMWMLHASDQYLARVDITTGLEDQFVPAPMPLEGGFWTVLAIHKATGDFYAVATTGEQSDLYLIDTSLGSVNHVLSLGIPAVISGTFDASGMLYLFDVALDEMWVADLGNNDVSLLGPAGFDGNYAQGMGYDSWTDRVFLSAYNNTEGSELRLLDRATGATTLIGSLPGETTGFGFPVVGMVDDYLKAGLDYFIIPVASLTFGEELPPIPEGFFDPGSLPFEGWVTLEGSNSDGGQLPGQDLIVHRLNDLTFPAPLPSTGEIPIEIVQLNLRSVQPITVVSGTGQTEWHVELHLIPSWPQGGTASITKENLNGGNFDMQMLLMPELIFTDVLNLDNKRIFNPAEFGFEGLFLSSSVQLPWMAPPIEHEFDPFWEGGMSLQTQAGSEMILVPLLLRQDNASLSMDEQGVPESWEGTGFSNSEWFNYPNFNWWNVWFYDHPLSLNRRKFLGGVFNIMPRDPSQPSSVEVIVGWSTPQWPTWNGFPENAAPPLPGDVPDPILEEQMIERSETLFQMDGLIDETQTVVLPSDYLNNQTGLYNFNPEWIFIDVRGYNFMIYGELDHICFKPWPTCEVICPEDMEVCATDEPFALTGASPAGGTYSGNGVSADGVFNPGTANWGINTITYTYICPDGTVVTCSFNIYEIPPPEMVCPPNMIVCESDGVISLSGGLPSGGSYSGTGVSGNSFSTIQAGIGTHEITYSVTEPCPRSCTFTITVSPNPEVDCPDDFTMCESDASIDLMTLVSPQGGSFTGGQIFDPSSSVGGPWQIKYTYTDPVTGCKASCVFYITVYPNPDVDCPQDFTMCEDDAPIDMMGLVSPQGGSFDGGQIYDPATAPLGVPIQIKYTYTDPVTGCKSSCIFYITVYPNPDVECPDDMKVCEDDSPISLTASPAGGSFSGAGISGSQFNPATAGVGTHTIEYCYTDPQTGCEGCCEFTVTVHPKPDVNCPADIEVCEDDPAFVLTGATPAGGTYSDFWGNVINIFNPAVEGAGLFIIYYDYTDPVTGCSNYCYFTITVHPLPVVNCPPNTTVCLNDPSFALGGATPAGGVYSDVFGVPVVNFNPAAWGVGVHTIYYDYTDPNTGCSNWCSFTITVLPLPNVTCPGNMSMCIDDGIVALAGATPAGGTYAGSGVAGGNFNPAAAGAGVHNITYTYTDPTTGCSNSCTFKITVNPLPVVTCPPNMSVCIDTPAFPLAGAAPAGGVYSDVFGIPVVNFNPAARGVGLHLIFYDYTDPVTGCSNWCSFTINVNPLPVVTCPANMNVCIDTPAFPLAGAAPAGGVYSDGFGIPVVNFNPAARGVGLHLIFYDYTDPVTGCSNWCSFTINVNPLPVVTCPPNMSVCIDAGIQVLAGANPVGGTFAGPGVAGGTFDPATAGVGVHNITYTYTDPVTNCSNSCNFTITVFQLPQVNCPANLSVFIYDQPFLLAGATPVGGVYTNAAGGVVVQFDPSLAGLGNHIITYTYTDNNGCTSSCEFWINVFTYYDYGDAPDGPYPTLLANNGAHHMTDGLLFMGSMVDGEADGIPTIGADGDDVNLLDDEDGVTFTSALVQGQIATVEVIASTGCKLNAWIDFNQINGWADAGEHVFNDVSLAPGVNTLSLVVPAGAANGNTYARFRVSYNGGLSYDGYGYEGEVEDYKLAIITSDNELDYGDAPDGPYPTLLVNNGARHLANGILYMGSLEDIEADGQPTIDADGDDLNALDDEDGVTFTSALVQGQAATVEVIASTGCKLNAWIDFNQINGWADAGEHVFNDVSLAPGVNTLSFVVPAGASTGDSYARFRVNSNGGISYDGYGYEGEVEDYKIEITQSDELDFGDAPENPLMGFNYPTTLANNGARHAIDPDVYLGNLIDTEPDGQPTLLAHGDDINNLDDEDGVVFVRLMAVGRMARVRVKASTTGYLNTWIDFNKNGAWADAGEQIFVDQVLSPGWNTLTFAVPASSSVGKTYARFRFNTTGGLGYDGLAQDGEVEDYRFVIYPANWGFTVALNAHLLIPPSIIQPALKVNQVFILEEEDLIGLFYVGDDGSEHCAGALMVPEIEGEVLIAYGDDQLTPEKDGFNEGEPFRVRIFRPSSGEEFEVSASYNPEFPQSDGNYYTNGLSAITSFALPAITQTLAIPQGWSGISSYVTPADPDLATILDPVLPNLNIMYNFDGTFWPGQNLYTLSQWNAHSGFVINVSDDALLDITGDETADKMLWLNQGWNLIPVLSAFPVDIEMLFSTIQGEKVVKEVAGMGVYWSQFGINSIGSVLSGSAYFAHVDSPGFIDYNLIATDMKSETRLIDLQTTENPWNNIEFAPASHLVAFNLDEHNLVAGDLVGGFNSQGQCTGVTTVNSIAKSFALSLNGIDLYSSDKAGLESGEKFSFRVYRPSTGEMFDVAVVFNPQMNTGEFENNGLSEVTVLKLSPVGVHIDHKISLNIYPNPSTGIFNISGADGQVEISVFDILGNVIISGLFDELLSIDLTGKPEGVYFVEIQSEAGIYFEKLIKQ